MLTAARSSHCRVCKAGSLTAVVDLGAKAGAASSPADSSEDPERRRRASTLPLAPALHLCSSCGLLQLKHASQFRPPSDYRSGVSSTARAHLQALNEEIRGKVPLAAGDSVLDIGSNDATFLRFYPEDLRRIGCDFAGKQFAGCYAGLEHVPDYFTKEGLSAGLGGKTPRLKVVSSIAVFNDVPDPVLFASDVASVLDDEGVWALEQSYVLTMLQRNSIDTICHEHLEYYGVRQIKAIMDRAGLKIIDVSTNDCNGGSFRIYVAKKASTQHAEAVDAIAAFLQREAEAGLDKPDTYRRFLSGCDAEVAKLTAFLDAAAASGKRVQIYGASTKGNCLLQYAGIDSAKITYAVERNLDKVQWARSGRALAWTCGSIVLNQPRRAQRLGPRL